MSVDLLLRNISKRVSAWTARLLRAAATLGVLSPVDDARRLVPVRIADRRRNRPLDRRRRFR